MEELRRNLDPEEISLVTWERFRAVVLPLHRQAASLLGPQSDAAVAVAAADAAAAAHDPTATLELLYFNGLTGRGHAGKGLRAVRAAPGAARKWVCRNTGGEGAGLAGRFATPPRALLTF